MKQFDTQDWGEKTATNRTAGFYRSARNEIIFSDIKMPTNVSL